MMQFSTVDIIGQIADLKDVDCKNTLAIATLIELLADKGLFSKQEFAQKARELDNSCLAEFALRQRKSLKPRKSQSTQRDYQENDAMLSR